MPEDRLPHFRNAPRRQPELRIAHQYPSQRQNEEASSEVRRATKGSPWWLTWIVVPTVAALVSASLLAYFLLNGERTAPQGQLVQVEQQQPQHQVPAQETPRQVAQSEAPPPPPAAQHANPEPEPQQATPEPEPWSGPPPPVPNDAILLTLIRSTLTALWQANLTGNYSVLRDMGARTFKDQSSVERLAQIFAGLRERNIDISAVLVAQPKLYRKAEIGPRGNLVIRGFFETRPKLTNFNLIYQPLRNGRWQLLAVSVSYAPWPQRPVARAAGAPRPGAAEKDTQQGTPAGPATQAANPAVPKPASKQKPIGASESADTAEKKASEGEDIRDRIDDLVPQSPPPEQPKKSNFWNPFDR